MKKVTQILLLVLVISSLSSCSNILLKQYRQKEFTIDTKGNTYVSKQIISKEVGDFTIHATIEFKKSYRDDASGWAGFFIKTDNPNGKHREDYGYLLYVREDGEIGFHTSPPHNKEIQKNNYDYPIASSKKRDVIIRSKNSEIQFLVDNNLVYKVENLKLKGKYISANAGACISTFEINYIKKN